MSKKITVALKVAEKGHVVPHKKVKKKFLLPKPWDII